MTSIVRRRDFLRTTAAAGCGLADIRRVSGAEYDLMIRGGRVIDPSRNVDGVLDLAVRGGRIAAVDRNIISAAQSIDARGKLVVPGLIDIHVHARDAALPPREFLSTGVTTMADAGSRGAANVDALIEVARTAANRMRIFLNIARLGNNPGGRGEFLDGIEPADTRQALAAVQRHRSNDRRDQSASVAGDRCRATTWRCSAKRLKSPRRPSCRS